MPHDNFRRIDGKTSFVICSRRSAEGAVIGREETMQRFQTKTLLIAAALAALAVPAFAQSEEPTPWELKPNMAYVYDKEGKTVAYKMGTNNAGLLLKGAKKVPKGTLFFIGQNGQLYMRSRPYLEDDGKFMFGSN
jgi:hypothetical protein